MSKCEHVYYSLTPYTKCFLCGEGIILSDAIVLNEEAKGEIVSDINQCNHEWGYTGVDDEICVKCEILKDEFEKQKEQDKKWLYEFAGRAMQEIISSSAINFYDVEKASDFAVVYAKALLERLKKEEV